MIFGNDNILALEIKEKGKAAQDRPRPARSDPTDEPGKPAVRLGSTANCTDRRLLRFLINDHGNPREQ
jgi:hypothetical protein